MQMKKVLVGCFLCFMLLFFTVGCGGSSNTPQAGQSGSLKEIIVSQPVYGDSWLPIYLADQLGYYEEEGLKVSFVNFDSGPLVIAALIAGDSHFALTGYDQVLKTHEQEKEPKCS